MNTEKLCEHLERLESLAQETKALEFHVSARIVNYLLENPMQKDLTIVGLRTALGLKKENDMDIVSAAYVLSSFPFSVLEANYRLYDEALDSILTTMNHSEYMEATKLKSYIDEEGDEIPLEQFQARVFPYFVNAYFDHGENLSMERSVNEF